MNCEPWAIRARVYDAFLSEGRAPSVSALAAGAECDERSVREALRALHDQHHIVLQADGEILAAHPFSNVPMPFDVYFDDVRAWGFCIWDALGIAAMSGQDTLIETRCDYCLRSIVINIEDGKFVGDERWVAQYLVPAQHMWETITFTCGTQLPFCDETHAHAWRERFNQQYGSILPMETAWKLAKVWYGEDRRSPAWRRRTVEEANAIFASLNLPAPFWRLVD